MGVLNPPCYDPHTHLGLDWDSCRQIVPENYYSLALRSHQPRLTMLSIIRITKILPFC